MPRGPTYTRTMLSPALSCSLAVPSPICRRWLPLAARASLPHCVTCTQTLCSSYLIPALYHHAAFPCCYVQFGSAITYLYEMAPTGRKGLTASLGQVAVSPGMILGILMCQVVLYGCTPGKGVRVGAKSESDARGLDVCLKGMYRAGVEFWAAVGGSHNQYYAVVVPPKAMFGRWPKLAHKDQASQCGCTHGSGC